MKRIIALLLAAALLLSGCSLDLQDLAASLLDPYGLYTQTHYADMEYIHPDMTAFEKALEDACETARSSTDPDAVLTAVFDFYAVYDDFYTNYALADIRYSCDLTDTYWQEEYNYCAENLPTAQASLDELYRAIAAGPTRDSDALTEYFGEGFFDPYEGEGIYDDAFLALLEQEAALVNEYYTISEASSDAEYYSEAYFTTYGTQLAQLYVELIALRQKIAQAAGYDSYAQYAYDWAHYRDYTPDQTVAYLDALAQRLSTPYAAANRSHVWEDVQATCTEAETFAYVKHAAEAMGGTMANAFSLLEEAGVYDIAPGENKHNNAFEIYLWNYRSPFIFMYPYEDQTDKLTFAHEFGHFCNDYACEGSYAGTDVAEVHSQAFEYLSLCYGGEDLAQYKLADSLCIYMENAAYALFEHKVYELKGTALTAENVQALYEEIGTQFGFDSWAWDSRDYVTVPHFFIEPMYVISYVVSNDVAMQIYQKELAQAGEGVQLYEQCLMSHDSYLLYFADTYGLESPFNASRLDALEELFCTTFPN